MSQTHDGWILTKTRKFAPNGRLQIGQILATPFKPEYALMPTGPLAVPDNVLVDTTEDSNVSLASAHDLRALFKLWADVNPAIPVTVGVEAGMQVQHSDKLSWHFDTLSSTQISPTLAYVQKSMEHGEVPAHLKAWRWDQRVFMVTGVTVARGARMVRSNSRAAGVHASARADLSGVGVGTAGATGRLEASDSNSESLGGATDFVFAYSLNEIFYRKGTHRPFAKGEVQSVPDGENGGPATKHGHAGADLAVEIETAIVDDFAEDRYQGGDLTVDEGFSETVGANDTEML